MGRRLGLQPRRDRRKKIKKNENKEKWENREKME